VQLSYTGNPITAGKCNKPKSICKNKNTTEIIKWLSDCNCKDKGNYVSDWLLDWFYAYCQELPGNAPDFCKLVTVIFCK